MPGANLRCLTRHGSPRAGRLFDGNHLPHHRRVKRFIHLRPVGGNQMAFHIDTFRYGNRFVRKFIEIFFNANPGFCLFHDYLLILFRNMCNYMQLNFRESMKAGIPIRAASFALPRHHAAYRYTCGYRPANTVHETSSPTGSRPPPACAP